MYSGTIPPLDAINERKQAFPRYMVEQLTIYNLMNLFGQSELSLKKANLLNEKLSGLLCLDAICNDGIPHNQRMFLSDDGIVKQEISKAILDEMISKEDFLNTFFSANPHIEMM